MVALLTDELFILRQANTAALIGAREMAELLAILEIPRANHRGAELVAVAALLALQLRLLVIKVHQLSVIDLENALSPEGAVRVHEHV